MSWLERLLNLFRRGRPGPWNGTWTQYSSVLHGVRTIYPSRAAHDNDPVWGRQVGAVTYARRVRGWPPVPLSDWTRVYEDDLMALRRED